MDMQDQISYLRSRWEIEPRFIQLYQKLGDLDSPFLDKLSKARKISWDEFLRNRNKTPLWQRKGYPFSIWEPYWDPIEEIKDFPTIERGTQTYYDLRGFKVFPVSFYGAKLNRFDLSFSYGGGMHLIAVSFCSECIFEQVDYNTGPLHYGFEKCIFSNSKFRHISFSPNVIANCQFTNCKFSKSEFTSSDIMNTKFDGCDFREASLGGSRISDTRFVRCNFRQALFEKNQTMYLNSEFIDCDLRNTTLGILPPHEIIRQS